MAYNFSKASILIVEDNVPILELIKPVVETFGFGTMHTARNGKEAFELFCKHNYDIIVTDWMMKPMNGISLAKMIRQHQDSPNRFVPIILMTGFNHTHRVLEARDSGITEFLVKPFSASTLFQKIQRVIEAQHEFVETEDFMGPDRRRHRNQEETVEADRRKNKGVYDSQVNQ